VSEGALTVRGVNQLTTLLFDQSDMFIGTPQRLFVHTQAVAVPWTVVETIV
jgi:hypothetical protein